LQVLGELPVRSLDSSREDAIEALLQLARLRSEWPVIAICGARRSSSWTTLCAAP